MLFKVANQPGAIWGRWVWDQDTAGGRRAWQQSSENKSQACSSSSSWMCILPACGVEWLLGRSLRGAMPPGRHQMSTAAALTAPELLFCACMSHAVLISTLAVSPLPSLIRCCCGGVCQRVSAKDSIHCTWLPTRPDSRHLHCLRSNCSSRKVLHVCSQGTLAVHEESCQHVPTAIRHACHLVHAAFTATFTAR